MASPVIITIDGPSGVGKGTLCLSLAEYLGFHILDSGALYRLTALNAVNNHLNPADPQQASEAVNSLDIAFKGGKAFLHQQDVTESIREEPISQAASKIAVHQTVRDALFDFMQDFVKSPGIVADGRDMGTVVFPNADLKFFLTARTEIRAKRRYKQLKDNGKDVNLDAVFSELSERDRRDSARNVAPLQPAKDAVIIDTGDVDVEQVLQNVIGLARQRGILP